MSLTNYEYIEKTISPFINEEIGKKIMGDDDITIKKLLEILPHKSWLDQMVIGTEVKFNKSLYDVLLGLF